MSRRRSSLGKPAASIADVALRIDPTNLWKTTIHLLAHALERLGVKAGDGDALRRVEELEEGARARRRNTSAAEQLSVTIVDAVIGELRALCDSTDETRRLAGEALLGGSWRGERDAESLALLIEEHVNDAARCTPASLQAAISAWIGRHLPASLEGADAGFADHLAGDLVAALLAEHSFQERVGARFRKDAEGMLKATLDRLAQLETIAGGLRDLTTAVATLTGRPTARYLDELCEYNRPTIKKAVASGLRDHLCKPLKAAHVNGLLEREGLDAEHEAGSIPRAFCYVPHSLKVADPWRVPARAPGRPAGADDTQDDLPWRVLDLGALVGRVAAPRETPDLLLVEAEAGFGKTTFLHRMAAALADHPSLLPIEPLQLARAGASQPVDRHGLEEWAIRTLQRPEGWRLELFKSSVRELVNTGRAVLFVDGLDQRSGAHKDLAQAIATAGRPWRVVASCRRELHAAGSVEGWSAVVRLGVPDEEVFSQAVPESQRELLRSHLGGDDWRHPFFLHVARLLDFAGRIPEEEIRTTRLLELYLAELFALGVERREGAQPDERGLAQEEWAALGALGLTSLRLTGKDGGAQLQRIDGAGFERAKHLAREAIQRRRGDVARGEKVLDDAAKAAHLLYLVDRIVLQEDTAYLFHHQLLQEFLAARAIVDTLADAQSSSADPAHALEALVGDIVQPRRAKSGGGESDRGDGVEGRVLGLRVWAFVADLLADDVSPIEAAARGALVRGITKRLWGDGADAEDLGGACRSALLRVRDELIERDEAALAGLDGDVAAQLVADPVFAQFASAGVPPDPFMLLCWKEERQALLGQVDATREWIAGQAAIRAWLERKDLSRARLEAQLAALLGTREGALWEVAPYGPTLGAWPAGERERTGAPPSWLLVPAGPFLAGSGEYGDEMPVRIERVARPFWIARHPVTVQEYSPFVEAGYKPNEPWWRELGPDAAEAIGDRQAPWLWQEQRKRVLRPVVGVSWFEAAAYCRWRSRQVGPLRLPAEAEWEKAARGLWGRRWPWGCGWRGDLTVHDRGWNIESLALVAENRNVAPTGAAGKAGNAWEWTATSWSPSGFGEDRWPARDSRGVERHEQIVLRGGSFIFDRTRVRCAYRLRLRASLDNHDLGFRCVRDVEVPPEP